MVIYGQPSVHAAFAGKLPSLKSSRSRIIDHPPVPAAPDALAALRHATAQRHTILDSGLAIGAENASLHDYRAHLCMLRAWLGPAECWLAGFDDGPQADAGIPLLLRTPVIDADLAHPAIPAGPAMQQPERDWPIGASAAWRWGVCYVIEGSQLGGAVLYKRLVNQLAPHPLDYLRGAEEGPGPRWRTFMQALNAAVRSPEEIAQACAGACEAFDRILALRG